MAISKIPAKGAIVNIKAKAGSATAIQLECIEDTWDLDWGTYNVEEVDSLCGKQYNKGDTPSFSTTTWKTRLDGDQTDEAQVLLFQALKNQGDFASDNTLVVDIEFNNSGGTNGTKISYELIVIEGKTTIDPNSKLDITLTVQPTTEPILTPLA